MRLTGPGGAEGAGGDKNPMQQDAVGLGVRKEVVDGRPESAMTFPVLNLPPGTCPGGGTERADGADAGVGGVGFGATIAPPAPAAPTPPPTLVRFAAQAHKGRGRRMALLGSTVGNTPAAHKLAAQVARAGGWTVQMAIAAALQAGRDWRPGAAEARQRMAEAANRLRGEALVPPLARTPPPGPLPQGEGEGYGVRHASRLDLFRKRGRGKKTRVRRA